MQRLELQLHFFLKKNLVIFPPLFPNAASWGRGGAGQGMALQTM